MSIFKGTLDPIIAAQLKAREAVVSTSESRDSNFLLYTTGKNAWVRLRSFVNYDSHSYNKDKSKFIKDGRYSGTQLAQKYVLEGGTLYNQSGNLYGLRSGVGKVDGVYASNLDLVGNTNKVDRLYGLRPMPGIISVEIQNKSAYGSLREATVQFYCWDKHQLEELEVLYMRVGYSCFLEWGWSQYLDHKDTSTSGNSPINNVPGGIGIKTFDDKTLNVFQENLTDDVIYDRIDKDIEKYKGNYDALLGYVKNFSWQLMPNGGFQCTTTLISRGEAIDTIKASSNPNTIIGSKIEQQSQVKEEDKLVYSQFEKIFLNIIAHVNESEYFKNLMGLDVEQGQFFIKDQTKDAQIELRDRADAIFKDINLRLTKGKYKTISGDQITNEINPNRLDLTNNLAVKLCEGKGEGTGIEYISMDSFIAILNEFFLIKNIKKDPPSPVVSIILPNNTPCLASEDSVSIDPITCLIRNSKASFICNNEKQTNIGFQPKTYSEINAGNISPGALSYITTLPEFIQKENNIGSIGSIYLGINKLVQIYRDMSGGPDGVDIIQYLNNVLDAVSFALGGINDFKLYNNKNTVQIIDVKYLESEPESSKFKFDLIGLKSICRDVKINSRIFSEQATMIAIGATSDKNANLGDIYSSTQNYFNIGLSDRILKTGFELEGSNEIEVNGTKLSGSDAYYFTIYNNVESLSSYLNVNVLGKERVISGNNWTVTKLPQSNQVVNAGSLLKTFHYQINGKDTNFKALIPFELEITLDGIGGLVVGQIFTIDKSILPRDYVNKKLGFIITGISHSLRDNDWVTNIRTQVCLLENDKIEDLFGVDKKLLKEKISEIRVQTKKKGWLVCALADYMVHETTSALDKAVNLDKNSSVLFAEYNLINALNSGDRTLFVGTQNNLPLNTNLLPIIVDVGTTYDQILKDYVKNWWEYALTQNLDPDFPKTFDEFISTDINGKKTVFSFQRFIDSLILQDGFGGVRQSVTQDISKTDYSTRDAAFKSCFIGKVIDWSKASFNIETDKDDPPKGKILQNNTFAQISDKINDPKLISKPHNIFNIGEYGVSRHRGNYKITPGFDSMFSLFYKYIIDINNCDQLGITVFKPSSNFQLVNYERIIK